MSERAFCQPEIATVVRQYAFRAVCEACGWRGPKRWTSVAARADAKDAGEDGRRQLVESKTPWNPTGDVVDLAKSAAARRDERRQGTNPPEGELGSAWDRYRIYAYLNREQLDALEDAHGGPVIHRCPPKGSSTMPCCGLTPLEVPPWHRMTTGDTWTCGEETVVPEPSEEK